MKTFIACVLVMMAVTAGAENYSLNVDHLATTTFVADAFAFSNPKNSCLKFSFGENKFSVCGIDNASKIMVDDCETIGFVHAWKVEETMVSVPDSNPQGWISDNWGNKTPLGMSSYITKRTRRCLNCTVVEEEYNEVTPKWRRK